MEPDEQPGIYEEVSIFLLTIYIFFYIMLYFSVLAGVCDGAEEEEEDFTRWLLASCPGKTGHGV